MLIIEKHDKSDNRKADLFDSMKIYKQGCLGANIKEAGKEKWIRGLWKIIANYIMKYWLHAEMIMAECSCSVQGYSTT